MTFKPLNENDIVNTRTLLHEAIPIAGTIVSGSYTDGGTPPLPTNLKSYSHGMFQTVYDYNYLSSSANHIFDVTCGISSQTGLTIASTTTAMETKKKNIYGQMSQLLMGYDLTGSINLFDQDGDLYGSTTDKMTDVFVIPFSRLLVKDEIKKETFSMVLDVAEFGNATDGWSQDFLAADLVTIADTAASTEYRVNSPAGEYGILYATGTPIASAPAKCGLIYYQAGIVVLDARLFTNDTSYTGGLLGTALADFYNGKSIVDSLQEESINTIGNGLLHRIQNIQFNNTTELNSTVYFCRVNHNEFNYSSNPTYLENSRIRVKTQSTDEPVSYITTVGLYNDRNELLATAKLSEALKKSPSTEFTIRARLDY